MDSFRWLVDVLDASGRQRLEDALRKAEHSNMISKRECTHLQTQVHDLELEKKAWIQERAQRDEDGTSALAQLKEATKEQEGLRQEKEHWQNEHSFATVFNATACLYATVHTATVMCHLRGAFEMMYFNWVSTTREERLRSNLLDVQNSFEALQHSSQRDLKEFEELCLQQFEAEMSQTKEAEHSRRLDLVEERDELRREVSALQSQLARTVAEKVRLC